MRAPPDRDGADRGSATVWAAAAVAAVLVIAVAGMHLGGVLLARHRAESAADLAALAAAGRSAAGPQVACARARELAERMSAEVVSCRLEGWDVLVETQVRPAGPLAGFGSATARARAGPVTGDVTGVATSGPIRTTSEQPGTSGALGQGRLPIGS